MVDIDFMDFRNRISIMCDEVIFSKEIPTTRRAKTMYVSAERLALGDSSYYPNDGYGKTFELLEHAYKKGLKLKWKKIENQ